MTTENSKAPDEAQREEASTLLTNALVCANVPTNDIQRARHNLYERPHTTADQAVATFLVENIEEVMSALRSRGISFEEYDIPDLKTENGMYSDQSKTSWFKDQDGNLLAIEKLPKR